MSPNSFKVNVADERDGDRLKYFCRYMHSGHVLDLPKAPDGYTGPTCPTWIQGNNLRPAYVDTVALYVKESDGEHVRISTVNRHPEADWSTSIDIPGFGMSIRLDNDKHKQS